MKSVRFTKFITEYEHGKIIAESLNTPVEFYMTDDTKMPIEIYAAMEINGNPYGMSFVKSNWEGVYLLDFYYIVNKKKKHWRFKNTGDIKQALSSILKFFEACQPFLGTKLKGVIFDLPAAGQSEKYVELLGRIIKRSHIKTYKEVPVSKKSEKVRNYLFMIKKNIQPETLFKSAHFTNNFKFDGTTFEAEALETVEPLKIPKRQVSTERSELYIFGKLKVELTANEDLIKALDDAAIAPNTSTQSSNVGGTRINTIEEVNGQQLLPLSAILCSMIPELYEKYKNKKITPKEIDNFDFKAFEGLLEKGKSTLPRTLIGKLRQHGFTETGSMNLKYTNIKEKLIKIIISITNLDEETFNQTFDIINNINAIENSKDLTFSNAKKLNLDYDMVSNIPEFELMNDVRATDGSFGFIQYGEDGDVAFKKEEAVLNMKSMDKWLNTPNRTSSEGYRSLFDYTTSEYADYNDDLRAAFGRDKINFKHLSSKVKTLMEYFKTDAPALEAPIWVLRNTNFPEHYEVGENIIDAAFLSTSVRSSMSYNSDGDARLKIYLPTGTKGFPIFGESDSDDESEFLLPPFSVLKVVEKEIIGNKHYYTCVMLGSCNNTIVDSTDTILLENENMTERDKKETETKAKPDKSLKYSSGSKSISKKIDKAIKDGKLKVQN